MKESKPKRITASLFCEILNGKAPLPKGRILVIGDVELPRHVETLPPNVTFNDALIVEKTLLREFNHVVNGAGFFRCNRQLRLVGPKTSFWRLDMEGSPVTIFEGTVTGDAYFSENMRSLKAFGPTTAFGGSLDARGTSLRSFNHCVAGDADFSGVKALKHVGPNARFGANAYFGNTSLQEFNAKVKGDLSFVMGCGNDYYGTKTLKRIGPNAIIEGNLDAFCSPLEEIQGHVKGNADLTFTPILTVDRVKNHVTGTVAINTAGYQFEVPHA